MLLLLVDKKKIVAVFFVACLAGAYLIYRFWNDLMAFDFHALIDAIAAYGPIPFFIAMTIFPALWVPISPFLLLAGALYSIEVAILGSLAAVFSNIVICWLVSGKWLRPFFERMVGRFGYSVPDFKNKELSQVILIALLLRMTPGMPFPLQNYVLGVARMPFFWYLCVSIPIVGIIDVCIILFGDALLKGDFAMAITAVCLLLLIGFFIRYSRNRIKARELEIEIR